MVDEKMVLAKFKRVGCPCSVQVRPHNGRVIDTGETIEIPPGMGFEVENPDPKGPKWIGAVGWECVFHPQNAAPAKGKG